MVSFSQRLEDQKGDHHEKPNLQGNRDVRPFLNAGRGYFLSQVWLSRADSGRELDPSDTERRLAKEYPVAKGNAKSQKVEVAVR